MGTRHLIAVVADGDFRVAQYGQWDGYPSGQGTDVLNFVSNESAVEALRKNIGKVRFATDEDRKRVDDFCASIGAENGWMDSKQADKYKAAFPALSRDVGADILTLVAAGGVEFVADNRDFALDSLFCEWAYVVDLDRNVLEVYQGFQEEGAEIKGRWAGRKLEEEYRTTQYAPVTLVAEYPFDKLPDIETFVSELERSDEDDA